MKKLLSIIIVLVFSSVLISSKINKTVISSDNRYKDINIGASLFTLPTPTIPDVDEFVDLNGADTGVSTYAYGVGEGGSSSLELQHDYAQGTDIVFHCHFQGIVAPDGGTDNVKFQLIYTISRNGNALAAATTVTVEDTVTVQYGFKTFAFAAITGTALQIGDQFLFDFSRVAASADEYAGDALMATVGVHYQVDSNGSQNITSK